MCTMPSTPKSSARPADHLSSGRAVALGVAQVAPGDEAEQQRHEPGEQADRAGDDGAGDVADAAGQLPPHGGGDDDGEADQEQPGTVATVLGVEVAGGVADPAYAARRRRGRRRATRSTSARASAVKTRAIGPGPLRTARGAGRRALATALAAGLAQACALRSFPTTGSATLEPPLPVERAEVLLLRDAGGEDVRVAMLANLPRTPHPPLASHAARESRRCAGRQGLGDGSRLSRRGRCAAGRSRRSARPRARPCCRAVPRRGWRRARAAGAGRCCRRRARRRR